jgi:hypothetical protein
MSAWTEREWGLFFDLLDKAWPSHLEPGADRAYRLLLDGTDPERVVQGVRRLLHQGARFRPSAAEILASGRADPGRPTFAEAYRLIFGPRGVLQARPTERRFHDAGDRARAYDQAALTRAAGMHPLIGAFLATQGLDRLRDLRLGDDEYGELRRRELAVAPLPSGDARRGRLRALDPLTALGLPQSAPALVAGAVEEEDLDADDNRPPTAHGRLGQGDPAPQRAVPGQARAPRDAVDRPQPRTMRGDPARGPAAAPGHDARR